MATFTERTKLGSSNLSDSYRVKLEEGLLERLKELKIVHAAEAVSANLIALDESKQEFKELMKDAYDGNIMFNSYAALQNEMERVKTIVIKNFLAKPRVDGQEFVATYRPKLELDITDHYQGCKTILEAKASSQRREALEDAMAQYKKFMDTVCRSDLRSLSGEEFHAEHQRMKNKASDSYNQRPIMFSQDLSGASELDKDVEESYLQYFQMNSLKKKKEELANQITERNAMIIRAVIAVVPDIIRVLRQP